MAFPCERFIVGPVDPRRGHQLHEVGGWVFDPRHRGILHAAQEGHGALLDPVWALGPRVEVDLRAVVLLEGPTQASEWRWSAGVLGPDLLDPWVDLLPDERLLEDAGPEQRFPGCIAFRHGRIIRIQPDRGDGLEYMKRPGWSL